MVKNINRQAAGHIVFYALFGLISTILMGYYLSNTVIHFTTPQQFPINSFQRFPLTFLIFPAEIFSFLFTLYFVYNLLQGNHEHQVRKNPPSSSRMQDQEVA